MLNIKDILAKKINSKSRKCKLVKSIYGHYYVTPMPSRKERAEFYRKTYFANHYEVSLKGMDAGSRDKKERFHYDRQYDETIRFITARFRRKNIRILDVGCGLGGFLKYLRAKGFTNLYGTEFGSPFRCPGITIFNGDFLDFNTDRRFDLIVFNNVLEHVARPEKFLKKAHALLDDGGFIRVQVPNDLSYTQYKATEGNKEARYYFFSPKEHLHYFDFGSMERMLAGGGFCVVKRMTTWPMDLFILMRIDYQTGNS